MAEKKPKQPEQGDERTEGEDLLARDEVSIKPTSGDPVAPERQLPGGVGAVRYVVQRDALGPHRRGALVTADQVGGEERLQELLARGALAPANEEG